MFNATSSPAPAVTASSAHTEASGKHAGILIAFVPWVLFTLLAQHLSLQAASAAALAAAVAVASPDLLRRRLKVLELGAVAAFVGFAVIAFAASPETADWVSRYARAIAAGLLALIAFASLAVGSPFTEAYAREQVPQAYWGSDEFHRVNRKLTALWGSVFCAMVISHSIAGTLDTRAAEIVFNWVLPVALILKAAEKTSGEKDAPAAPAVG